MSALTERQLLREIKDKGCSVGVLSKSSHFVVLDPKGKQIAWFAVKHPGNWVLPKYVSNVRKALSKLP